MAKAENETTPRDQLDKLRADVLEALRKLPIRRGHTVNVGNVAENLAGHMYMAPISKGLRKEARKFVPAAVSKQLDKIRRKTSDLVNVMMYSPEAMALIETEFDRLPKDRLSESELLGGGSLSPLRGYLIYLVFIAEKASKTAPATAKEGRPPSQAANLVTRKAADAYERLTGKSAGRKSCGFQEFLKKLFEIGGISASADERTRAMVGKRRSKISN